MAYLYKVTFTTDIPLSEEEVIAAIEGEFSDAVMANAEVEEFEEV